MSDGDTNESSSPETVRDWFGWLLLGVVLLLVIGIRLRTLDVPLERDEGEYAYIASLMLRGVPPYAEAYTMKFPGTPAMYVAGFSVFGESTRGVHLTLLVVNATTMLLMYWLARRWHDVTISALAAAFYGLWSLMPGLQGTSAHAEHFAVLFGLAGYALLAQTFERTSHARIHRWLVVLLSGLLFGTAVLMKQQAAFFVAPALLYLLWTCWRSPHDERRAAQALLGSAVLGVGVVLPFGVLVAILSQLKLFDTFWFWTIAYASTYGIGDTTHLRGMIQLAFRHVGMASVLLDVLLITGVTSLVWDADSKRGRVFLCCLCAGGIAAVLPSLRFYDHYFVFLLPAASLFAALGLSAVARLLGSAWSPRVPQIGRSTLIVLVLGAVVWSNRLAWFQTSMVSLSRITYGANPFPEAVEIAKFLKAQAQPGERLLVFGSEPELYFYTGMPAATKYIYTYPLVERQPYAKQMQAEMIEEIERMRPEYCVVLHVNQSWIAAPSASLEIHNWWHRYQREHYEQIGMADILGRHTTNYFFGELWRDKRPQSNVWIGIYRRQDLKPSVPRN